MKISKSNLVLVSGAAGGRQGSTGNLVANLLLAKHVPVRAFVHREDDRSEKLRQLGLDVMVGDMLDLQSVRKLMAGVHRAYFTYPVQEGLLEATTVFATAAREQGVELVVNLSQWLSGEESQPTPHQNRHWRSEQIFNEANIGAVHLDATVFFENLRALSRASLAKANAIMLPWGPETTKIPMIAAEDVARVAVGLLTGPVQPNGTVLPLVGDVVSIKEMVDYFREILDTNIYYKEITDEQWIQAVSGASINAIALEHLTHLWRHLRSQSSQIQESYQISPTIETIGGVKPKSLRQFLHEQKHVFSANQPHSLVK